MGSTGKGDTGYTSLYGGERIKKDAPRMHALGDLDEATSAIGVGRAFAGREASKPLLIRLQRELHLLMAEVAAPDPTTLREHITDAMVTALEDEIAALTSMLPPQQTFILPGDSPGGAMLDLARAVVRRAERRVTCLVHEEVLTNAQLLRYLNRLSSVLYLLARADDIVADVRPTSL